MSAHFGGQLLINQVTIRIGPGDELMGKLSVLLTAAEDSRFAAYCTERGFKKSTLIARLIREFLDRENYHPGPPNSDDPGRARAGTQSRRPRAQT